MTNKPNFVYLTLDQLIADKNNPRLPEVLRECSDQQYMEYMLLNASITEIALSICRNGIFAGEPLLVVPHVDNYYKVIEGNRRLAAIKLLKNPEAATVQRSKIDKIISLYSGNILLNEIPCLVFSKAEDIRRYTGYKHITGVNEWKIAEKACYLYDRWKLSLPERSLSEASEDLAAETGTRAIYVRRLLVAREIFNEIKSDQFSG